LGSEYRRPGRAGQAFDCSGNSNPVQCC
jgi:hypothetical protein